MRFAAFASLLFLSIAIRAQVAYTVTADQLRIGSPWSDPVDSVDYNFFRYHPGYTNYTLFNDLGNIGSALKPAFITPGVRTGFLEGFETFDPMRFREDQYKYYITQRAYSDLRYVQGGKEMLNLRALHSQNIKPWWNIGIQFNRLKSEGHYLNEKTSIYNTRLFNWFHTRDHRYHLFVNITWNRINNEENGGIISDSTFESLTGNLRQTDVFLAAARNVNKQNIYSVEQHYHLGKTEKIPVYTDTSRKTIRDSFERIVPKFTLAHKIAYTGDRYVFSSDNSDSLLYPGGAYKTLGYTHDSSQFRKLRNSFSLVFHPGQKTYGEAGITQENIHFSNGYSSAELHNASLYFNGKTAFGLRNFSALWEGEYFFSGYNSEDRRLNGRLQKTFGEKDNGLFEVGYFHQAYRPTFLQYFNYSNHYFWKNNFSSTQLHQLFARWQQRFRSGSSFMLSGNFSNYTKAVYFDTVVKPAQTDYTLLTLQAQGLIKMGKLFLQLKAILQQTDNTLIRIPEFGAFGSLFFQGPMFNRTLYVKAGVDVSYFSAYKAQYYDASIRQFYNQDAVTIGNYPVADLYFTGYVKTFSIGFKLEHANQGFSGNRYYASAHYPMAPRVFRIVIGWKLFD